MGCAVLWTHQFTEGFGSGGQGMQVGEEKAEGGSSGPWLCEVRAGGG